MPTAAPHPCAERNCPALAPRGQSRCDQHTKERKQQADKARPSAATRGYGWRWTKLRAIVLREEPLCVVCGEQGVIYPSEEVDHILALSQGGTHERRNLRGICRKHNLEKANREDGGGWQQYNDKRKP